MKEVRATDIAARVADLCIQACCVLPPDVVAALESAREREESPLGRQVLERLLENAKLAAEEQIPTCQDTGLAIVFVELGGEVRVAGGYLAEAIAEGVRQGMKTGTCASPSCRAHWTAATPATIPLR